MYIFILIIHVIVCFVLILVVLLQAGRGGGFSDMLGGGQPQSLFGTQTNAFMLRATEVCAVMFILTSLTLALLSTQRNKSLVTNQRLMKEVSSQVPSIPQPPPLPPKAPDMPAPSTPAPVAGSSATPAPAPAGGGSASGGNAN